MQCHENDTACFTIIKKFSQPELVQGKHAYEVSPIHSSILKFDYLGS